MKVVGKNSRGPSTRRWAAVVALTAAALAAAGCADTGDPTPAPPSGTAASASQSGATASTVTPTSAVTPRDTTEPVDETSGGADEPCFDPQSATVQSAITSLKPDVNGGGWRIAKSSKHSKSSGCGLNWVLVNGDGVGDATYQSRVLLFAGGKYMGTVAPKAYSYTSIAGDTVDSVTVRYRWLRDTDPFCCPQGGPSDVTASLVNQRIVRDGQFPPDK